MWHSIKNYAVKNTYKNCGQDSKAKRTQGKNYMLTYHW